MHCCNIRVKQTEESHKVFLSYVISGQYSKAVLPQSKLEDKQTLAYLIASFRNITY